MQALRSKRTAQQTPLNRYSKRIVLLMSEAVRFFHQFERIYASGRCGDGLRLVSVGGGPSHPADDDCEREQNGGSQRHDGSHRSLLGRFESSSVSLLTHRPSAMYAGNLLEPIHEVVESDESVVTLLSA